MEDLRGLALALGRLALRQEDQIATLRSQSNFMWFCNTGGQLSLLATLYPIAMYWRAKREEKPPAVKSPLRTLLCAAYMEELLGRLRTAKEPGLRHDTLLKHGWMNPDYSWPYLSYDMANQKEIQDTTAAPLPYADALATVDLLRTLLSQPDILMKFSPTRPLAASYTGEILLVAIIISSRGDQATKAWEAMSRLVNNGVTKLVGLRIRPERMRRCPPATEIQNLAAPMWKKQGSTSWRQE